MFIVLGSPLLADNPNDPPEPPEPTEAEVFVQEFENFATDAASYGNNTLQNVLGSGAYNTMLSDLQNMAENAPEEIDNAYDSAAYFQGVRQKWTQMMNTFGDYPDNTANQAIKSSYAEQVKEFIKGYMNDMTTLEEGGDTITLSQYLNDYQWLNEDTENDLEIENNPPDPNETNELHAFDPFSVLDQGVPTSSKDAVKVELDWGGAYDRYKNYTIAGLLDRIGQKFSTARKDADWFLAAWGGSENAVMQAAQNVNWNGRMTQVGAEYNLNSYGEFISNSDFNQTTIRDRDGNGQPETGDYSMREGNYNNRSFGFRNGNFTSIKVTIGNRKYSLYDRFYTSPIVLDMDGDGKLQASNGKWLPHAYQGARMAEFDINGDGFMELTEWVGPTDGLLMVYSGGEANANNLFGEAGGFLNGYEKLTLLDANQDGKLSGEELKTLSVWQDSNSNAKVDAGEVSSVMDLGITSIALNHDRNMVSSFDIKGENRKMWDWYPAVMFIKRRD
jgi:hypothetical protein